MSNPEFKRNLWLSFSTHRLIGMPAFLALIFMTVALTDFHNKVADNLYVIFISAFIFIVWLWGARNANASIVDELRDKTWDQQRMSSLDPWMMTWGKLFGSTSFNWYGGLMCLVVIAASGIAADKPDLIPTLLSLCAVGIFLHATLIALNLHTSQFESRLIQRGGMGWLAIIAVFMFMPAITASKAKTVWWWGMDVDRPLFLLDSSILFAACATFAAWRVICNALQIRTLPWAWPAFACILAFYIVGFMQDSNTLQQMLTGLFVSITMTYIALFTEPNTLVRWRKLRLLQSRGDWRGWLEHLPLWPTTLALTFIFAFMVMLISDEVQINNPLSKILFPQHALALALMLLRDTCILLFFTFSKNNKRALGAAALYLVLLNMLLPYLANAAHLNTLRYFFIPIEAGHDPWSSVLIMTFHAACAIGLVNWRLRNSEQL